MDFTNPLFGGGGWWRVEDGGGWWRVICTFSYKEIEEKVFIKSLYITLHTLHLT